MTIEPRHEKLLAEVVRSFIKEAEPVGSKALESRLGVSSATIRNDMASLADQGLLSQPHTSAGRIPTIKGYQYYLDNLMSVIEPKPVEQKLFRDVLKKAKETEDTAKEFARQLAATAKEAVLIGFSPDYTYYTGLANLFEQPEFVDVGMVREIGRVVDHLDEGLKRLMPRSQTITQALIGKNNPFGEDCAIIFTQLNLSGQTIFIGLLGPVRMDYDANFGRLNYVTRINSN